MPIVLKPGAKKHGYEVVRELNRGAFAFAYEARKPSGERVFFKQYKSPTLLVDWYAGFVEHQKELKRRITEDPAAKDKCYRFEEFFEDRDFFQVFEFIDGGKNLTDCIASRGEYSWTQMAVFAKVMMLGIKALHQIKIVHADLKPDNIILIPDDDIKGHRLRIVDMDWSIFSDKRAPWHGKQGYVGTPGYQSPEHLRGDIPVLASDIFTCGIMLGEVLGGKHPFGESLEDDDEYKDAVLNGRFKPVVLLDEIDRADKAHVEAIINACLSHDPGHRPTAATICDALIGKTKSAVSVSPATTSAHRGPTTSTLVSPHKAPVDMPRVPLASTPVAHSVSIIFGGKSLTTVTVDSEFGRQTFKSVDADAKFLSNPQFKLFKRSGQWMMEHSQTATNETIVNGHKLMGAVPVKDGMQVAVGNSSKGIEKFPLTLRLHS